jgi:hypothetical protein
MLYEIYFTDGGVPKTGLTPDWESLLTVEVPGVDKSASAPAISEIGGGKYLFEITFGTAPWDDKTTDLTGVIDGGSSLVGGDRYKPVSFSLRSLALARLTHERDWAPDGTERVYGVDGIAGSTVEMTLTRGTSGDNKTILIG